LPENNKLAQLIYKMSHDCFVLNRVVWKQLRDNQQYRSVLLVPQHLIPEILHEAHGHLLAGHWHFQNEAASPSIILLAQHGM
jgi:hypothetical protein